LAERQERAEVVAPETADEALELGDEADDEVHAVDPELIRKLEEFKRTMFDPSRRDGDEG
jgi:hypothetical protein